MKAALFAFNGEPMCFVHVLLNAFDLRDKGWEATIVIEGSATKLVKEFHEHPDAPFAPLYRMAKEANLIGAVCQACANKMGSLDSAKEQGLPLGNDMAGHPSMSAYLDRGWQVFTF
ncbi:MAG TPA: cytoplasmic protein [bacterium]|nr:cytoplasmic protein [bacterium]